MPPVKSWSHLEFGTWLGDQFLGSQPSGGCGGWGNRREEAVFEEAPGGAEETAECTEGVLLECWTPLVLFVCPNGCEVDVNRIPSYRCGRSSSPCFLC